MTTPSTTMSSDAAFRARWDPEGQPTMTTAQKMERLQTTNVLALACRTCIFTLDDRPKGEYRLNEGRMISNGPRRSFWCTHHRGCTYEMILCKARDGNGECWYEIRPPTVKPGPSGQYGLCEFAIDEMFEYVEKDECPAGRQCTYAHNERECLVWTGMFDLDLNFYDMRKAFLDVVYGNYSMYQAAKRQQVMDSVISDRQTATAQVQRAAENRPVESAPPPTAERHMPRTVRPPPPPPVQLRPVSQMVNSGPPRPIEQSPSPPQIDTVEEYDYNTPDTVVPTDAVRPGAKYKALDLEITPTSNLIHKVHVTRMIAPNEFIFQFHDNIGRMQKCWDELNAFYNSPAGDEYAMDEDEIIDGLPVAVRFKVKVGHRGEGEGSRNRYEFAWRRCEIMHYVQKSEVIEVCDVDYGGIYYVLLASMRLLKGEFIASEKQAVQSQLANVTCTQETWQKEAVLMATNFIRKERPLTMEFLGSLSKFRGEYKLAVRLVDDTNPNQPAKCFNEELVKRRFVVPVAVTKDAATPFPDAHGVQIKSFQRQIRTGRLPKHLFPRKPADENDDY